MPTKSLSSCHQDFSSLHFKTSSNTLKWSLKYYSNNSHNKSTQTYYYRHLNYLLQQQFLTNQNYLKFPLMLLFYQLQILSHLFLHSKVNKKHLCIKSSQLHSKGFFLHRKLFSFCLSHFTKLSKRTRCSLNFTQGNK